MPIGAPKDWTPGAIVTAADLNIEIRDQFKLIYFTGEAWTTFTPGWYGTVSNPNPGNATMTGRARRVGKTVFFRIGITMGNTTTYGSGEWIFELAPSSLFPRSDVHDPLANGPVGGWRAFDSSAVNTYVGQLGNYGTQLRGAWGNGPVGALTPTTPISWANGDTLSLHGHYEIP